MKGFRDLLPGVHQAWGRCHERRLTLRMRVSRKRTSSHGNRSQIFNHVNPELDESGQESLLFLTWLPTRGKYKLFLEENNINQSIKLFLKCFIHDTQNETRK